MTAAKTAKSYGVKSLKALTESTGYNIDTLRRMHRDKPVRFKLLCLGSVCDELRLDGVVLREMHVIIEQIKEGQS
jgi:hypothetical protein